jgi:hypothetical protein
LKHENTKIRVFSPKISIRPKIKGDFGGKSGENGGFSGKNGEKKGKKKKKKQ